MSLIALNQAVKNIAVTSTTQAPVLKLIKLSAQEISPGGPTPILGETTTKAEKSSHDQLACLYCLYQAVLFSHVAVSTASPCEANQVCPISASRW